MLEGAKATTETVDALRSGAATMKAIHKATYVPFSTISISGKKNGDSVSGLLYVVLRGRFYHIKSNKSAFVYASIVKNLIATLFSNWLDEIQFKCFSLNIELLMDLLHSQFEKYRKKL